MFEDVEDEDVAVISKGGGTFLFNFSAVNEVNLSVTMWLAFCAMVSLDRISTPLRLSDRMESELSLPE